MADRWDRQDYGHKSIEDMKDRYYEVSGILQKLKGVTTAGNDKKIYTFDAEHERKRKDQLNKLFDRTPEQVEEEQMLLNEMKKIDAKKKERERKTQDLQKLISQADREEERSAQNLQNSRKHEKKLYKKKLQSQARPSRAESVVNAIEIGTTGIKFSDLRGSGVSLRSQKMKLPANVGQKKVKALEQAIQEFKVGEFLIVCFD